MATKGKKTKVDVLLDFDRKEGKWKASIGGTVYGLHRYERRALIYAIQKYAKEKGISQRQIVHSVQINWTAPAKKIHKIFTQSQETLKQAKQDALEAERALQLAKKEHRLLTAGYVAALMDYGVSVSGAMRLADAATNTVMKYINLAGGEEEAARFMWKRAKVNFKGMLGQTRHATTSSGEAGGLNDIWSMYDQSED